MSTCPWLRPDGALDGGYRFGGGIALKHVRENTHRSTSQLRRRKPPTTLTESQRQTIFQEAAALGIRPSEYVTMILTLSRTIRKSLAQAESFDLNNILEWASNPVFSGLLSGLIGSVRKTTEKTADSPTPSASEPQTSSQRTLPAQTFLPPNGAQATRPYPQSGSQADPRWSGWM